ncbi:M23 family metallopeptidase [Falsiroseomonas sp. CW058]|uniref:M23 family metallopeptidase n=1 Tax=Falsiroseomonas sp. CW058 TaxID=3388664 RepID=UPI003D31D8DF
MRARPSLPGLLALLLALAAPRMAAAEIAPGTLRLPVAAGCVSSGFGPRPAPGPKGSEVHHGIDLPAPAGAWVHAAAAGEVVAIRRTRAGAGLEVELRHAGGLVTRYAHLGTVAPVLATGRRRVAQGDRLGRIGRTGITYGTHLHLEVLRDGRRLDPAPLFGLPPCAAQGDGGNGRAAAYPP